MGKGKMHFINEEEGEKTYNENLILAIYFSCNVYAFLKFTSVL